MSAKVRYLRFPRQGVAAGRYCSTEVAEPLMISRRVNFSRTRSREVGGSSGAREILRLSRLGRPKIGLQDSTGRRADLMSNSFSFTNKLRLWGRKLSLFMKAPMALTPNPNSLQCGKTKTFEMEETSLGIQAFWG